MHQGLCVCLGDLCTHDVDRGDTAEGTPFSMRLQHAGVRVPWHTETENHWDGNAQQSAGPREPSSPPCSITGALCLYLLPCKREKTPLHSLARISFQWPKRLLEKAMAPHSSTLAWKIPWTEEPGRLQSMGLLRVGGSWATSLSLFTFMHWRRKWHPTPVFLPGESQGRQSLVGCSPWGCWELDTTERLHFHFLSLNRV